MARLTLSTRAERIERRLAGRDLTRLPKTVLTETERFTRAIGIGLEQFLAYKPSTRRRYIAAAKKGRTVAQERERVREQRKAAVERKATEREAAKPVDTRVAQIYRIRDQLKARGMDTTKGPLTHTDLLDFPDLLSNDSIREHINTYGVAYVLKHLQLMLDSIDNMDRARTRWQNFRGSNAYPDDTDERWFWYHTSAYLYGPSQPGQFGAFGRTR